MCPAAHIDARHGASPAPLPSVIQREAEHSPNRDSKTSWISSPPRAATVSNICAWSCAAVSQVGCRLAVASSAKDDPPAHRIDTRKEFFEMRSCRNGKCGHGF